MKIAAIIAEYNPFHNGHQYLIDETRRLTGADYILAVMSGDFVQRGAPALCNKYLRTQMALSCGIDAVLELPAFYALSSAEFFASGSISLLNQLGVADVLSFGSESGEISQLTRVAELLCDDSLTSSEQFSSLIKKGFSYPAARVKIMEDITNPLHAELLSSPNNILGVEYCKALKRSQSLITPFTVKRSGDGYHNKELDCDASVYGSASAIRKVMENGCTTALSEIQQHVPKEVYSLIQEQKLATNYLTSDDFSSLLHYKLLSEQRSGFSKYPDCTPDLSEKICKHLPEFTTLSEFVLRLKSKDLTYTRISRVLFHILLNFTYPDWYEDFSSTHILPTPYARLLGFRKDAQPLLTAIRKNSSIPLLSKLADASSYLDDRSYWLLKQDIFCASVYESVHYQKTGISALNEFRQSPIKVS